MFDGARLRHGNGLYYPWAKFCPAWRVSVARLEEQMQPRGVDWLRLHLSRRVGSQVLMSARNSLTALLLSGTAALMVAQGAARAQQAPTAPEQRREERQERRQDQRQEHQEQRQSAPQRPAPQSQPAATDHPTAPATGPAAPGEQRPRGT